MTGASGKTGQHIVRALAARHQNVRALVHKNAQVEKLQALGAKEVLIGDMRDAQGLQAAFAGITAVYHIAPNVSPDELSSGQAMIAAGLEAGTIRFVYHSVLHPQVEEMPHHWLKLRVEEALFKSGLEYTILQPAVYMQNLLGYRDAILNRGVYAVPYSIDARQSLVDLNDVAEVAASVLIDPGHAHAVYELVGKDAPSPRETAQLLSDRLGKPVRVEQLDRKTWEKQSRVNGMNDYAVKTLLKMFAYYEQYHFYGNSNVLSWLLGREPGRYETFLNREFLS